MEKSCERFTFIMPNSKASVDASLVEATNTPAAGFTDVNPSAYSADAVVWAVENGIPAGTGIDTFSPK